MKPTVMGLCNALGIDRQTFYNWGTGRTRSESSDRMNIVKKAHNILEELWEDYMLNGKINPVSGIFLGKNHFGYADKQEVVLTPNDRQTEGIDAAAIRERYLPEGKTATFPRLSRRSRRKLSDFPATFRTIARLSGDFPATLRR